MAWTVKLISTDDDGLIITNDVITGILRDYSIEMDLGDEQWVQSGALNIVHDGALTFSSIPLYKWWIAIYWDSTLIDVYRIKKSYDEKDDKRILMKSRLDSIQKMFFNDCADTQIAKWATASDWNYALDRAAMTIEKIKYWRQEADGDTIQVSYDNRYGFSLGDLIEGLSGKLGTGYRIGSVNSPIPIMTGPSDVNLPILFRGASSADRDTAIEIIFQNIYTPAAENREPMNWMDIFRLAIQGWNSFVRITPVIDTYLDVNIDILPRTNQTPSASDMTWIERKTEWGKYLRPGVKLESSLSCAEGFPSWSTGFGNFDDDGAIKISVEVADPNAFMSAGTAYLFLSPGNYVDTEIYRILDAPDGEGRNYFSEGEALLDDWYEGLISSGQGFGYSGEILYSGERVGDHKNCGLEAGHIIKLSIDKDGIGSVSLMGLSS